MYCDTGELLKIKSAAVNVKYILTSAAVNRSEKKICGLFYARTNSLKNGKTNHKVQSTYSDCLENLD